MYYKNWFNFFENKCREKSKNTYKRENVKTPFFGQKF